MKDVAVDPSESQNVDMDQDYINEYWSTYRQHVHTLLAWGYVDSRDKIQTTPDEPAITGFIAEAIQTRLNALDCPQWCNQIAIHDDPPVPGQGRAGRKRLRPDIVFESVDKRPRPLYHFEAKRLGKRQGTNPYLGQDGIQCFLDGRYAQDYDEAGMLGYVQSEDISIWTGKLQKAIHKDFQSKNTILLFSTPCTVQIIEAFPQEWISKHSRPSGKNITIYHILLDCIPK
jgi:hypothetical protein